MGSLRVNATSTNAVVLICDAAYMPAALFVAGELLDSDPTSHDIIVIVVGEMPSLSAVRVDARIQIVQVVQDESLHSIPYSNRKSPATFVRLKLDRLLGEYYEKILYLDCDVRVRGADLFKLFSVDLGKFPIAAVRDAAEIVRPNSASWAAYRQQLGLSPGAGYFNSGVLLIDCGNFARCRVGDEAIQYLLDGKFRGGFHDQSALNAVLNGNWLELSPVWNWMFAPRIELTKRYMPSIIHFIGPNKPWKDKKGKHLPEYRCEMDRYLQSIGIDGYIENFGMLRQLGGAAHRELTWWRSKIFDSKRDKMIEKFMSAREIAAA